MHSRANQRGEGMTVSRNRGFESLELQDVFEFMHEFDLGSFTEARSRTISEPLLPQPLRVFETLAALREAQSPLHTRLWRCGDELIGY